MTPFGEHFALGIKDLLPMAFAECAASVDKGIDKTDLQAAWFGQLGTADGFPSGILADTLGLPDLPVTRVENSCATGQDAIRNALFAIAAGAYDVALVMGADKVRETASKGIHLGMGADGPATWRGITRWAWSRRRECALHLRRYLHESPATREHMANDRGEEPPARRDQPQGTAAVRDHPRRGAGRAGGVPPDRRVRLCARRATAPPRSSWPPRTSSTGSPTGRCGSVASALAWIRSCISTSAT